MAAIPFPKEMEKYPDEWVCLTPDNRIGGHGKTPGEAMVDAGKNGEDNISLFYAAREWFMEDMVLIGGRFVKVQNLQHESKYRPG